MTVSLKTPPSQTLNIMKLNTRNGHSQDVIDNFNQVAQSFSHQDLLHLMLTKWADDDDLADITKFLLTKWADDNDLTSITNLLTKK